LRTFVRFHKKSTRGDQPVDARGVLFELL